MSLKVGNSMKTGIYLLPISILFLLLAFVPYQRVIELEQSRPTKGSTYYIPLTSEEEFSVTFTHSIHLSDVTEIYKVTDSEQIQFYQMIYEDLAIGMPGAAEENQTFEQIDGKWVLTTFDSYTDFFTLYNSSIHKKLEVGYDNTIFDLKKELPTGRSFRVQIDTYSWIDSLKGEKMDGRKQTETRN